MADYLKNAKVVLIPLDRPIFDMSWNFSRSPEEATYDDANLRSQLAQSGQTEAAVFAEMPDGSLRPLKGNRRLYNLRYLRRMGVEDPQTCKQDEKGNPIPGTGKVFEHIKGIILKGLSDIDRRRIMTDHGTVRTLSREELQRQLEGLWEVQMSEKEAVMLSVTLIQHYYPPKREIKPWADVLGADGKVTVKGDDGKDLLSNYKGLIDTSKRIWKSPECLHTLALAKLKGQQKWPTNNEVYDGVKIHEEEVNADASGKIDRVTPGPNFLAWFERLLEAHKTMPGETVQRGKSISMMNNSQLREFIKVLDSRFAKWLGFAILNDPKVFRDKAPVVCKLLKSLEATMTAEQVATFDACWDMSAKDDATKPKVEEKPPIEEEEESEITESEA